MHYSRPISSGSNRGFTLIELLVVIAIIGILASVVLASLNAARVKARDTKRMAEIDQLAKGLEMYFYDVGRYPQETACDSSIGTHITSGDCSILSGSDWDTASAFYTSLVPQYMPKLPIDPVNDSANQYRYEPQTAQDFCIMARLEGSNTWYVKKGGTGGTTSTTNCP